ncbi:MULTISPECIES: NarK family nitrate/nitrite MFS transporter [Kordiimonas]|jgi:NNP family nitrate/nitrite transporter-like MFS transporter|uniref:Nitrate/nitrite transporter n=1 Tax=Kordiimonas lacus TaxID=637679 RepID=A0A1G6YPI2_9PROT|nr:MULTISPECIES: NarK family nitrate/nitrite MFS transporter [Kordiimonas]SDD92308.1 MFS transporter, NNP family, nitrate/nitrite transporter [Kordiimonas lacus]
MSNSSSSGLNLLSFSGKTKVLHLTWFAFFLSFAVWFNHAPLMASIRDTFGLSDQEVKTLLILNVALTIPARIVIGMLVDQFGPRLVYALLLVISGVLCLLFATADSFETLALFRFLLGFVGAGFVIGIRLISEWFPAKQLGVAEGIYGGWGNFGSAAAALSLPSIALLFGGPEGWRYAVGLTGVIAMAYAFVFYRSVRNTPKGSTYFKPKKAGAMEVTSYGDLALYIFMKAPLLAALALLAWKLGPANLSVLSFGVTTAIYAVLAGLYAYQVFYILKINLPALKKPIADIHKYEFRQVAVLDLAYLVTFGSELAVVSMLPLFFMDTFEMSAVAAGAVGASFAFMNLLARPVGGLFSDKFGRKKMLVLLLGGLSFGYFGMSQIDATWFLPLAVVMTMTCSFFVQAGEGAVFAAVPLIKRRLTGQIAGMVGAYGNIGGVTFLTVLSFVSPQIFFLVIAAAAVLTLVITQLFMREPAGTMAEVLPDGTVQMIEVA